MSSQKELSCPLGKKQMPGHWLETKSKIILYSWGTAAGGYDRNKGIPSPFILSAQGRTGRFWEKNLSEVESVFSEYRENRWIGMTASTCCYHISNTSPIPHKATI